MADRATWKGFLQIAQVQIPIKVFPATETSDKLSFNQLHAVNAKGQPCHARIKQKTTCPTCEKEVPHAEIVKGFEFETGRYVVLLEDELDAVAPPSTRVIDLVQFAFPEELELRTIDRAYFLAPDGPEGGPAWTAYATVTEAMANAVGIGKLAIYGREYLVAVSPREGTLLLYTLHHAAELRTPPSPAIVDQPFTPELKLARGLIGAMRRPLDLTTFTDQYQVDLRRLIAAKIAGEEIVIPPLPAPAAVVNLKDALEQSLRTVKPLPAKASRVPGPHRGATNRRERQRA
jgi:DNA end-binding protein Ku